MSLVSLLKHDEPRVYLSDHQPVMSELRRARTRSLDTFEAEALRRLNAGEDIVTDTKSNRILMLGGVRAAHRCLACHQVHRGELLGAFSYELIREPSVIVVSSQTD